MKYISCATSHPLCIKSIYEQALHIWIQSATYPTSPPPWEYIMILLVWSKSETSPWLKVFPGLFLQFCFLQNKSWWWGWGGDLIVLFDNLDQPVSSLRGMVVITSVSLVKIHWYTPASDKPKLVIVRSLVLRRPPEDVLWVILPSATTCSPFLIHTTEGALKLPMPERSPAHSNNTVVPTVTAVRLSTLKTSVS